MRCGSQSTSSCTRPPMRMAWKCSSGSLETRHPPPSGSWSLAWSTLSVCSPSWRTRRAFQSAPGWPHVSAQNPSWQSQLPPACPVHNPPPLACVTASPLPHRPVADFIQLHQLKLWNPVTSTELKKKKKLKYSWFTMLISAIWQSDSAIHTYTHIYIHFSTAYWISLKTLITC